MMSATKTQANTLGKALPKALAKRQTADLDTNKRAKKRED
jgi:hypothetical protein